MQHGRAEVRAARTTEGGWPLTAAEPFTCKVRTHASFPPLEYSLLGVLTPRFPPLEYSLLGVLVLYPMEHPVSTR